MKDTQDAQLQGERSIRWPDRGGYLDFVLDDRSNLYLRFYVGQSGRLRIRLSVLCRHIAAGHIDSLHYYILNVGDGHRSANWMQLWTIPEEFATPDLELIQCFLETLFCGSFESLPIRTLRVSAPQESWSRRIPPRIYSGLGLNIVTPLLQGAQLTAADRDHFKSQLLNSVDPEIQSGPLERANYLRRQKINSHPATLVTPPSSAAYPSLIREQLPELGLENCHFDAILSNKPLSSGYFDLEYQTNKALG